VRLLNARNRLQLAIGDASLASLRLSGVFWANDPEAFVRLLGEGMAVRAERRDGGIVLRR
jgi:ferric-dicitrate binding protein FerR (iron transport regulator)